MGSDLLLEPKYKIFLSHSGAQKEFVDHLCKALEDRFHYPFFDRRHESLPKGEQFPKLIVQAAKQCEMLIVVVSDEYFMSKWPMIELNAFVHTHKLHHELESSSKAPKILPLFYGLSVSALDDATLQKKWFAKWESLAEADPKNRIIVNDWKYALEVLKSFNGLPYDRDLKESVAYTKKVVSSNKRWDDSHVQGKSNICQVLSEKIEGLGVSDKYNVKVLGLYGVGGIGKTTTCKTLCNEFSNKDEGKVCHIEFPIDPKSDSGPRSDSKEFFQKVLCDLIGKSMDFIQHLSEGECKDVLRKSLFKERTFLAMDNVFDSHQSIELAKTFLNLPYHVESLVVVTARSQSVLELLGIKGDACLEMPDLDKGDAMKLFLHHVVGGNKFFTIEEKHDVMTCVRRCYFSKGHGQGHHYHPLALRCLGLQLGCFGESPLEWVKHLPRARAFNFLDGENPVFDILRSGFDLLLEEDQTLFMDVGCFFNTMSFSLMSWLCTLHQKDEETIKMKLEHLRHKGLLEHVDLRFNQVTRHDLYLEFIRLELGGSFSKSSNLSERMWVKIEDGDLTKLKYRPQGRCWHKLIRLHIDLWGGSVESLKGIKWKYFANVEVLILRSVHLEHGALNLASLVCLRILHLYSMRDVEEIEGLGELENLTHFECYQFRHEVPIRIGGQFPSSLKLLKIVGLVILVSNALAQCNNLVKLELDSIEALSLDLGNCWSLESAKLCGIRKLHTLLGLGTCQVSCLQSLSIIFCKNLVHIPRIDHLISLKKLYLDFSSDHQISIMLNFLTLTKLQVLELRTNENLAMHVEGSIPFQLQKLKLQLSKSNRGLNLHGFNQLQVLDLSCSFTLKTLAKLGDLPKLWHLNLGNCHCLEQLPNLSKSKNLEELNLKGCLALILHERDIQILSELPLLQLVPFDYGGDVIKEECSTLDFHRRKLVMYRRQGSLTYEQEERDLGPPPIEIGNLEGNGIWRCKS